VHAQLVCRYVAQGVVEGLHMQLPYSIQVAMAVTQALPTTHGQVRTVDLENETGTMDSIVFDFHGVGQRIEISLFAGVLLVLAEMGNPSG